VAHGADLLEQTNIKKKNKYVIFYAIVITHKLILIDRLEIGINMGWKEKPHRKMQKDVEKEKDDEGNINYLQEEILKMQGLKTCESCFGIYRLYDPRCTHCDFPNTSFYPAKI